jgi:diguanylate cyclase (GGDEF)-like protein
MTQASLATTGRQWSSQRAQIVFGAAFMLFYTAGIVLRPSETYLRLQSNLLYNFAGLIALFFVLRRTGGTDRVERWGWRFIAAMLLSWQAGDWIYSYYDLALNRDAPFPSAADIFYTAGYVSLLIGLPLLAYPRRLVASLRWLLDVMLITTVAGCFGWVLIMNPILQDSGARTLDSLLALSYPLWDLGLVAVVVGALFAWHTNLSSRSVVLLAAMSVLVLTDSLYSYGVVINGYNNVGNPLEIGWVLAYLLIALAATLPANLDSSRFERRLPLRWLVFPYLLALPLPIVQAVRAFNRSEVDVLALGGAAALLLAFVSHVQASYMTSRALDDERRRARLDSLTGTLNHGGIVEEAEALLTANPLAKLCACIVDVDGLKSVNDQFGHRAGDQALKVIASRLRRSGGIVGRYGGDEFLVLFEPHTCLDGSTPESLLRQELSSAFIQDGSGGQLAISASFGLAVYPDEATDLGRLVELADSAMYRQKREKRLGARQGRVSGPFDTPVGPRVA